MTKNKILNPVTMLAAGLLLGALSRIFDIYTQNLGNIFSQMAIWILLGTLISIYSETKKKAMQGLKSAAGFISHAQYSSVLFANAFYLLSCCRADKRRLQPQLYYRVDGVCFLLAGYGIFCVDDKRTGRVPENNKRRNFADFRSFKRRAF